MSTATFSFVHKESNKHLLTVRVAYLLTEIENSTYVR